MICISITAPSVNLARKEIKLAKADLIELRLDLIKDITLHNLKTLLKKDKTIVTDRKNRMPLLKKAIEWGASYIDIDIAAGEKNIQNLIQNKKKSKIIVSFHNFTKTDKREIQHKYAQIKKLNPDIIKIATFVNSIEDNQLLFDLIKKRHNQKIITIGMGEKGQISRILGPLLGSEITYASLEKGKESALGQLTAEALKNIYRINILNNPKVFGLIGNPVDHSKGIYIHNETFRRLRQNSIYVNFLVDDVESFINTFKYLISGVSITIPHKEAALRYMDKVDPLAKKIGAINTSIKKKGKLIGYNTDVIGALTAIKEKTTIKNKKVLLIGTGGVGRAIAFGIAWEKGRLLLSDRDVQKAKQLSKELQSTYIPSENIFSQRNIDLLINATPVGMQPRSDNTPVPKEVLRKILSQKAAVFDVVYTPQNTKLLTEAASLGHTIISGLTMFNNQAKEQTKLFTQ
ncbi:MAG TPA: shikimate dehydrogenase [Candidatus Nanoarchaeia archaeon]|nr:shikimate dehydrogenase [Candidatus Nanoarchaeia archaeon]